MNPNGSYPVCAVVGEGDDELFVRTTLSGQNLDATNYKSPSDLVNVPVKHVREYWVNLYPAGSDTFYDTKAAADGIASITRLACKKITIEFEEGEGL